MSRDVLKDFLDGKISSAEIVKCIQNDRFSQSNLESLQSGGSLHVPEDFVPNFLDYLRAKLSSYLSPQQAASCSPKRQLRSRKNKKTQENRQKISRTSLLTRYSPDSSQSDNSKSFDDRNDTRFSKSLDNGTLKQNSGHSSSFWGQRHKNRKPKRVNISSGNVSMITSRKQDNASVNNEKSLKNLSNVQKGKQLCQDVNSGMQKKRITPTLITQDKETFEENKETNILFDSSPSLGMSESSVESDCSLSQIAVNEKKIKTLEKKMRKNHKAEGLKMPLAAFLINHHSGNLQSKDDIKSPCAPFTSDIHKVYERRLVSSPIYAAVPEKDGSQVNVTPIYSGVTEKDGLQANVSDLQSSIEESNERVTDFSMDLVTQKERISMFVDVYECILVENLATNLNLELYFLFGVMNCKIESSDLSVTQVSDEVFSSAHNCVYFAAEVLRRIKSLLVFLDKNSLKLVVENPRLRLLAQDIVEFIGDRLEEEFSKNRSDTVNVSGHSKSLGVPFQIEINNRKAFMSDRYFYSFSKLRDRFYGLVRVWEENHFNQEWHIDVEMGKDFREFFHGSDEFPTFAQFSELFVAQLVEMCIQDFYTASGNNNNNSMSTGGGLPAYLREMDPAKLQLLQDRFVMPIVSRGPCPKPNFTDVETFFQAFIRTTDSYQFAVHLKDVLVSRLCAINGRDLLAHINTKSDLDDSEMLFVMRQDFTMQLSEARILAKFLGYVVFLPYTTDNKSRELHAEALAKLQIVQPFHPRSLLSEALANGQLTLTIPWLVMYLSMMDATSLKLKINACAFRQLFGIYRHAEFRLVNQLRQQGIKSLNKFFILVHLGWLFEQPNIASEVSLYSMATPDNGKQRTDPPGIKGSGECDVFSPFALKIEGGRSVEVLTLDDYEVVNKSMLYRFCPYLSELKLALACAGAKSYRKIKPTTQLEKSAEFATAGEDRKLKDRLVENFVKYQPKYVKDSMEFVTERLFGNLKMHATEEVVTAHVKSTMESLKNDVVIDSDGGMMEIDTLHKMNASQYQTVLLSSKQALHADIREYSRAYCEKNAGKAVAAILPECAHEKVVLTTGKIIQHDVECKMNEWVTNKLTSLYENELQISFNRHLMGILKKHNKSFSAV
eukprot:gene12914-14245_t